MMIWKTFVLTNDKWRKCHPITSFINKRTFQFCYASEFIQRNSYLFRNFFSRNESATKFLRKRQTLFTEWQLWVYDFKLFFYLTSHFSFHKPFLFQTNISKKMRRGKTYRTPINVLYLYEKLQHRKYFPTSTTFFVLRKYICTMYMQIYVF